MYKIQRMLVALGILLCLVSSHTFAADRPSKTVLVAVDLSDSTEKHRIDYLKYFRTILDTMGEGDTLLVVKIAERPTVGETLAMDALQYQTMTMMGNSRKVKDTNLLCSIAAVQQFEKLLLQKVGDTPIIDVVQSAQRLLALHKSERQIIVFLSDMMESSKNTAYFESVKPLFGQKSAEDAFAKIKREGRIADLKGVTIYVAGARELEKDKGNAIVASTRLSAVKWFWKSYFSAAGAVLGENAYAPDFLKFDEIESNTVGNTSGDKKIFVAELDKKFKFKEPPQCPKK